MYIKIKGKTYSIVSFQCGACGKTYHIREDLLKEVSCPWCQHRNEEALNEDEKEIDDFLEEGEDMVEEEAQQDNESSEENE